VRVLLWHAIGLAPLTFVVPGVPLSFCCAGAAYCYSRRNLRPVHVLARQTIRLLTALWGFAAVAILTMGVVDVRSSDRVASVPWPTLWRWVLPLNDPIGSVWGSPLWIPLWFIRCYLWLLLLAPLTLAMFRRAPRSTMIGTASAGLLVAVLARSHWNTSEFGLYLAWWVVGYGMASGVLLRAPRGVAFTVAAASLIGVVFWVVVSPPPSGIANAIPPLHSLVALGWLALLVALMPLWNRAMSSPTVSGPIASWNRSTLYIFIWHGAGLLLADRVFRFELGGGPLDLVGRCLVVGTVVALVLAVRSPQLVVRAPDRRARATIAIAAAALTLSAAVVPSLASSPPPPLSGRAIAAKAGVLSGDVELTDATAPIRGHGPDASQLQAVLDDWISTTTVNAIAVTIARPDGTTWSGSSSAADSTFLPTAPNAIASVTKLFTGVAWLRALESSTAFSASTDIAILMPDAALPDVEVRQLLRHMAGYKAVEKPADEVWTSALAQHPVPDGSWAYADTSYIVAGVLLEQLTGMTYAEALRSLITEPIGLTSTMLDEAFAPTEANHAPVHGEYHGNGWSSSGLWSTTEDLARFGEALFTGDLLSPSSRRELLRFEDGYLGVGLVPMCPCHPNGLGGTTVDVVASVGNTAMITYSPIDGTVIAVILPDIWPVSPTDGEPWQTLDRSIRDLVQGRPLPYDSAS
jgi:CubicO group peptidase (beta-lactamase class C family)